MQQHIKFRQLPEDIYAVTPGFFKSEMTLGGLWTHLYNEMMHLTTPRYITMYDYKTRLDVWDTWQPKFPFVWKVVADGILSNNKSKLHKGQIYTNEPILFTSWMQNVLQAWISIPERRHCWKGFV